MKQVLQSLKSGQTAAIDVPCPSNRAGELLIRTSRTLVSVGTERMLVEFGRAGWAQKARQQPDKVRMVLEKIKTDGLAPTIEAVMNKLDQPLPLGYCNVGVVIDQKDSSSAFRIGDRVVSNGAHAQMVNVAPNLCARVPDNVSDDQAAFTVLCSIGLQGVRLSQPTLGEAFVVTGLGLIGLVTVQLLRAHGCRVLGLDYDAERLAIARSFGADVVDLSSGEDPIEASVRFSRGVGVDGVIITASTDSNEPVRQAALMSRKRGRIILVGVAGLALSRADFYEKELTFQVSCSYGPGRYDPEYEQKGHDYPVAFVRWTEQRNFEAVLDMMAEGRLDVNPLISHRFELEQATAAYEVVAGSEPSLGILLSYEQAAPDVQLREQTIALPAALAATGNGPGISLIGSGNYATAILLPALKQTGAVLRTVASRGGVSGVHAGKKFGFQKTTTDTDSVFLDSSTDAVFITTRHNTHASLILQALDANKHVFVEKPMCLTLSELAQISTAVAKTDRCLMVGFNRRFAPQVIKTKSLLDAIRAPKSVIYTVNAGALPSDHWTLDRAVGGGRIVGEACHFIDLIRHLVGAPIIDTNVLSAATDTKDTASIQLRFEDGSIGTVHYFANGDKGYPKERIEIFAAGGILVLDNFRKIHAFGWPGFKGNRLWRQDKGQKACAAAFIDSISDGDSSPIPFDELAEVSRVAIELADECHTNR